MIKNTLHVKGADFAPYYINIREYFEDLADSILELKLSAKRLLIVSDSNVYPLHGEALEKALEPLGLEIKKYIIPAGEENKTLDEIRNIYEALIINSFDRKDVLLALGGGVTGDMCGYAAATYLRGVDFIQVPTTLLSQVDSSVGGKTGVDFSGYKNMVGAFHQPRLVYIALKTLETLPERQFASGMAEVVKHGFIKDLAYANMLNEHSAEIEAGDLEYRSETVFRSVSIKANVVEHDPTEQGERKLLNFGHTLGHAIEKESGFTLTHGECVAIGCVGASYMSMKRGYISEEDYDFIKNLISSYGLPLSAQGFEADKIYESMKHDKKKQGDTIPFVLLNQIGDAAVFTDVTKEEVYDAISVIID